MTVDKPDEVCTYCLGLIRPNLAVILANIYLIGGYFGREMSEDVLREWIVEQWEKGRFDRRVYVSNEEYEAFGWAKPEAHDAQAARELVVA